jgi:hypothetical protein
MVGARNVMKRGLRNLFRTRRWLAAEVAPTPLAMASILTQGVTITRALTIAGANHLAGVLLAGQAISGNGAQLSTVLEMLACVRRDDVEEFHRRAGGGGGLTPHPRARFRPALCGSSLAGARQYGGKSLAPRRPAPNTTPENPPSP